MYSIVLMAALATGGSTPDWHHGCYGCHGGCYGCTGCYGCYGGFGCGGYACHGGYGGCHWGWACHGCYVNYCGGGYGCWGCSGCYGGYGCGGCYGCYGGYGCSACYGCYASCGCFGGYAAPYMAPAPGGMAPPPAPGPGPKEGKGPESVRATLTVEVPEQAKLFIDDQQMKTTSAKRVFVSPPLQPGQAYYYMLRAEVLRDGQTVSITRRVVVRPGEEATASFPELQAKETATAQVGGK